jgi:hypothetical protein
VAMSSGYLPDGCVYPSDLDCRSAQRDGEPVRLTRCPGCGARAGGFDDVVECERCGQPVCVNCAIAGMCRRCARRAA